MTDVKSNRDLRKKQPSRLRQSIFLTIACGGILPAAHADENVFFDLARNCLGIYGTPLASAALSVEFLGKDIPDRKAGWFSLDSVDSKLLDVGTVLGVPSHCLIKGSIASTSPWGWDPAVKQGGVQKVSSIKFQISVPADWNGKVVQLGGGGFSWPAEIGLWGTMVNTMFNEKGGAISPFGPLNKYAIIMSDAGTGEINVKNAKSVVDAFFGTSFVQAGSTLADVSKQELVRNFGQDSIKKSFEVGTFLINKLTGKNPSATYFIGYSTGGRQALQAAAKWPDLYDGVISGAPPADLTGLITAIESPDYVNGVLTPLSLVGVLLKSLSGEEWSNEEMKKLTATALANSVATLKKVALNSNAGDEPYKNLLSALAPVWNVNASDLSTFLSKKSPSGKQRKLILFQGTSDFLVPCVANGKFARDLTKLSSDEQGGAVEKSVRTYFIKDLSHGVFTVDGMNATNGMMSLSWDALSVLDTWVQTGKAPSEKSHPALSRNPAGNIPSKEELTSWGCGEKQ